MLMFQFSDRLAMEEEDEDDTDDDDDEAVPGTPPAKRVSEPFELHLDSVV